MAPETRDLQALVDDLPDAAPTQANSAANRRFTIAFATAARGERIAAVPALMQWIDDPRPEVRGFALATIGISFVPDSGANAGPTTTQSLPAADIAPIAAHLLDESGDVRNKAAVALSYSVKTEEGGREMLRLLPPLLARPDALKQFPDPFFERSTAYMLEHATTLSQRDAILRMQQQHKPTMLPAIGPTILGLIVNQRAPLVSQGADALLSFLRRDDQTAATLSDSLHNLALSSTAPEPVQNEALTRVFDKGAMTVFLLQFLNNLQLTPEHREAQRARLVQLSTNANATPQLRHAASTVAACWRGDIHTACKPDASDFEQGARAPDRPR